jgi:hypothetical protein
MSRHLRGITNDDASTSGPLTLEDLLRTWAQASQPPKHHAHLIAAGATPGALTVCSDCGAPVKVPDDWGSR